MPGYLIKGKIENIIPEKSTKRSEKWSFTSAMQKRGKVVKNCNGTDQSHDQVMGKPLT